LIANRRLALIMPVLRGIASRTEMADYLAEPGRAQQVAASPGRTAHFAQLAENAAGR
jgi:hypothetical protein